MSLRLPSLLLISALAACGQSGALYLPPQDPAQDRPDADAPVATPAGESAEAPDDKDESAQRKEGP